MRRRKRARAKSKKTGKVADWNRYKGMDKDLKKQLREAHTEYLTNIFADDDDRLSKKAWAYIKSRRKENIGIPPLIFSKMQLSIFVLQLHPKWHSYTFFAVFGLD